MPPNTSSGTKIIAKRRISHRRHLETGVKGIMAVTSGGCILRACCPNGTERGCPTRSHQDCQMSARNSMGFGVVERAAAETPINSDELRLIASRSRAGREQAPALRCLQNDLGNTPLTLFLVGKSGPGAPGDWKVARTRGPECPRRERLDAQAEFPRSAFAARQSAAPARRRPACGFGGLSSPQLRTVSSCAHFWRESLWFGRFHLE